MNTLYSQHVTNNRVSLPKYYNRRIIRGEIDRVKGLYCKTGDSNYLITVALLKGLYIAIGGTKGIPLSAKVGDIAWISAIVFKYMYKVDTHKNTNKAINELVEELQRANIIIQLIPVYKYGTLKSNEYIAELLGDCVGAYIQPDILINKMNIMDTTLKLLYGMGRTA